LTKKTLAAAPPESGTIQMVSALEADEFYAQVCAVDVDHGGRARLTEFGI
jgi:hypothetical protein